MPLDKLGSMLAQVDLLPRQGSRNGRHKIVLAAHSMGGLVALSAMQQACRRTGFPPPLPCTVPFPRPMAATKSARKGVENAPVVVPVWKDIASGSEFLQKLHAQPFPAPCPSISFLPTTTRLPSSWARVKRRHPSRSARSWCPRCRPRPRKVYGFNESHESFLNSKEAMVQFFQLAGQGHAAGQGIGRET